MKLVQGWEHMQLPKVQWLALVLLESRSRSFDLTFMLLHKAFRHALLALLRLKIFILHFPFRPKSSPKTFGFTCYDAKFSHWKQLWKVKSLSLRLSPEVSFKRRKHSKQVWRKFSEACCLINFHSLSLSVLSFLNSGLELQLILS